MGQALYRKYRSKKLSEIVGQEHITVTLANALKKNQISHAYLFTGPRGVGKTSVARIMAHEVNGFDYSEDNYIDIIEIDAASNRRIDEIRQLRDKVNIAPTRGKYKIYIIDEVHMLTREAFNALLKTLEEPPEHVIFILATTEAYKLPETIISRTQQFVFRPIAIPAIAEQLKDIAKKEKIEIDEPAINLIAHYGQGSFRDSISLLDQASSIGARISLSDLELLIGMAPTKLIDNIIKAIEARSIQELADNLQIIEAGGFNMSEICRQLIEALKTILIGHTSKLSEQSILELMKSIIDVPPSYDPINALEVILFSALLESVEEQTDKPLPETAPKIASHKTKEAPKVIYKKTTTTENDLTNHADYEFNETIWPQIISSIKSKYNTLYGIIRMAKPVFAEDKLILNTKFDFHQRLLSDKKNRHIIIELIQQFTNKKVELEVKVSKDIELDTNYDESDQEEDSQAVTAINNIFGSSEVVQ